MLIRRPADLLPSEITAPATYASRREFIQMLLLGAGASGLGLVNAAETENRSGQAFGNLITSPYSLRDDKPTPFKSMTSYGNFYEFGPDKESPAKHAHRLRTRPWTLTVDGEVKAAKTFAIEDILKWAPLEERIYRMRCVEGWSMVIPWVGYSLAELIRRVEPQPGAKFVEFVTLADRATMPGVRGGVLDWPYVEGLRMDEAMHPLTLLAFGMYGEVLPNQNGAPLRLVVPWKYGFKSAKSLVKIRFVDKQPVSSWEKAAPQEYGFYSNVNPNVDHPRWSQATERRIGEDGLLAKKRKTLMFNGYEAQVGQLYAGMDLKKYF